MNDIEHDVMIAGIRVCWIAAESNGKVALDSYGRAKRERYRGICGTIGGSSYAYKIYPKFNAFIEETEEVTTYYRSRSELNSEEIAL